MSGLSSMSNNVYDSASRFSNSLPNLGGSVPGLWSTVGLTEYSSVHSITSIPEQIIRQGLQSEYVCLDEFLQNYTVNNTEVEDIQSYVDSSVNVVNKNKRQKRRVTHLIFGWKPGTIIRGFCCPFMVFTFMMRVQCINF